MAENAYGQGSATRMDRARCFVRRQETVLSVVGAAIVLLSFAVREELQTSKHETIASMDQAMIEYRIRSDISDLSANVKDDFYDLFRADPSLSKHREHESLGNEVYRNQNELEAYKAQFDSTNRLIDNSSLDHDPVGLQIRARIEGVFNLTDSFDHESRYNTDYDFQEKVNWWLTGALLQYGAYAEARVQAAGQRLHTDLRGINLVSIVLFILGWTIGLVSRIFGREPDSAET